VGEWVDNIHATDLSKAIEEKKQQLRNQNSAKEKMTIDIVG
jgi:hypothetical protein